MTERTITVPTETEEQVYVCEECGEASEAEDIITYISGDNRRQHPKLHYHEGCLEDVMIDDDRIPEKMTYAELAKDASAGSHRVNVQLAMGTSDISLLLIGLMAVGLPMWSGLPKLTMLGAIVALGSVFLALARSRLTAKKAAEAVMG